MMKNISNKGSNIGSNNQSGGITAQNITINNYSSWSKGLGKFTFKNKVFNWSTICVIFFGCIMSISASFSGEKIATKEEFHQFLLDYLQSVNDKSTNVYDYFAENISIFIQEKNITPERVKEIREKTDYKDGRYNVDKESITFRKAAEITYWRFKSEMICYRPTKEMFQKCNVEMEYGINSDGKIVSIEQLKYWNLTYTKERPDF